MGPISIRTLMVWYDLFEFFSFVDAVETNEILNVSWIVLLLLRMVTFHAKGQTKANLVQVELLAEVIDVRLGE